jgi:hypothetical protein
MVFHEKKPGSLVVCVIFQSSQWVLNYVTTAISYIRGERILAEEPKVKKQRAVSRHPLFAGPL